jgi:TolB-like protein
MSSPDKAPRTAIDDTGVLTSEQIRKQVEKVIRSEMFVHSKRMQRFLSYTVDQALQGKDDSTKEYSVALAVFDKPQSFDPRLDPIVRVEAGRLRSKLQQYYEGPGLADPIRIRYKKRSYVPHFEHRSPEERFLSRRYPDGSVSPDESSDGLSGIRSPREIRAIAVLPFMDFSIEGEHEHFSDAITAEIINVLNQTVHLNIVARTSVMRFKETDKDIREIASRLGVDAILEGSVRLAGNRVRVTVQLANAANGYQIWSQIYDRVIADILDVQRDLAQAIAREIGTELQKG